MSRPRIRRDRPADHTAIVRALLTANATVTLRGDAVTSPDRDTTRVRWVNHAAALPALHRHGLAAHAAGDDVLVTWES